MRQEPLLNFGVLAGAVHVPAGTQPRVESTKAQNVAGEGREIGTAELFRGDFCLFSKRKCETSGRAWQERHKPLRRLRFVVGNDGPTVKLPARPAGSSLRIGGERAG